MAMIDWESLTTEDFRSNVHARSIALLPVAAVEQHGPHLPLGTDAMICDAVIAAAADHLSAEVTVLRLPTQRVGVSPEHSNFPGTLSVEPETALAAWTGIGESVAEAGLSKLFVFNSHGGQPGVVDQLAVRLRKRRGMTVAKANIFALGAPEGAVPEDEQRFGLHGGLVETALMLAIRPDLVRPEMAHDFTSRDMDVSAGSRALGMEANGIGVGWMAEDLNPAGVTGNAGAATPELGERLLDHLARRLADLLEDTARFELSGEGDRP